MNERSQQELDDLNVTTVFVDGCHHTEYVKIDCMLSLLLIGRKKGAIIFDDMENEEVRRVVHNFMEFLDHNGYVFRPLGAFGVGAERDIQGLIDQEVMLTSESFSAPAAPGIVLTAAALEIN